MILIDKGEQNYCFLSSALLSSEKIIHFFSFITNQPPEKPLVLDRNKTGWADQKVKTKV